MRPSTLLTLIGATLVIASPLHQNLHKRKIVWDVVTKIEYVTITDDGTLPDLATVHLTSTHWVVPVKPTSSKKVVPTTTSTPPPPPPPPPAPTTSSTPPPPATTAAPAPAPETSVKAVVFAATTAAPASVVEPVATPVAATPVVAPVVNAAPNAYAQAALNQHNKHRANHTAPALTWSSKLAEYAQTVADSCHFAHDLSPGGGGYGQNIDAVGYSAPADGWDSSVVVVNSITNGWYNGEAYTYAQNNLYGVSNPSEGAGQILHFTQMVWDSTTTVGCASKSCPKGWNFDANTYGWYTVCNYGPAGNYAGEYAQQVNRPIGGDGSYIHPPEPYAV